MSYAPAGQSRVAPESPYRERPPPTRIETFARLVKWSFQALGFGAGFGGAFALASAVLSAVSCEDGPPPIRVERANGAQTILVLVDEQSFPKDDDQYAACSANLPETHQASCRRAGWRPPK